MGHAGYGKLQASLENTGEEGHFAEKRGNWEGLLCRQVHWREGRLQGDGFSLAGLLLGRKKTLLLLLGVKLASSSPGM